MPFCSSCGNKLSSGDKFCNNCGEPIKIMPSQDLGEAQQDVGTEKVKGVIPHLTQATGQLRSKPWILISTNQRILIAQFSGPMMQEALEVSKKVSKGFAKLLAGKVLTSDVIVEYCRRFFTMSPDQIFNETPGNFSLKLADVRRAYIEYEQEPKDEDSHIRMDCYILNLVTERGDYSYVFDADPQDMKVLQDALGDKVKGEGRKKALKKPF